MLRHPLIDKRSSCASITRSSAPITCAFTHRQQAVAVPKIIIFSSLLKRRVVVALFLEPTGIGVTKHIPVHIIAIIMTRSWTRALVLLVFYCTSILGFKWEIHEDLPYDKYYTFSERYMFGDRNGPAMMDQGPSNIKIDINVNTL
jgi:hypothetical protein